MRTSIRMDYIIFIFIELARQGAQPNPDVQNR
jgi:hypothetical protein